MKKTRVCEGAHRHEFSPDENLIHLSQGEEECVDILPAHLGFHENLESLDKTRFSTLQLCFQTLSNGLSPSVFHHDPRLERRLVTYMRGMACICFVGRRFYGGPLHPHHAQRRSTRILDSGDNWLSKEASMSLLQKGRLW